MHSRYFYAILYALFFSLLTKLFSYCTISPVIDSIAIYFSAASSIKPLVGAFGGASASVALLCITVLSLLISGQAASAYLLAFSLPGFFAALYWSCPHWTIRFLVPLACMILFVTHPVGAGAALYSLYWFIPMIIYCTKTERTWLTALGSTFTAHAVGSVVWLYTTPMTSATWLALIPVVARERLIFAVGMVAAYYACALLFSATKKICSMLLSWHDQQKSA